MRALSWNCWRTWKLGSLASRTERHCTHTTLRVCSPARMVSAAPQLGQFRALTTVAVSGIGQTYHQDTKTPRHKGTQKILLRLCVEVLFASPALELADVLQLQIVEHYGLAQE